MADRMQAHPTDASIYVSILRHLLADPTAPVDQVLAIDPSAYRMHMGATARLRLPIRRICYSFRFGREGARRPQTPLINGILSSWP